MRTPRVVVLAIAMIASLIAIAAFAGNARADYGPLATYQVGLSFNCNNPSLCGPDLGGFWGWAVFNSDGSADAELTGCGHGGGFSGAGHFSADASWFIGDNGDFWTFNETDTYVGSQSGTTFTATPQDTGIPAAAGHYSSTTLFGFKAQPGTAIQIQVAKIPGH